MGIGRMKGGMVEDYSQTLMHFYPSDKKILYKANIIRHREKVETLEDLHKRINEVFKEDKKEGKKSVPKNVELPDLMRLMNGSSVVSADATVRNDEEGEEINVYTYTA